MKRRGGDKRAKAAFPVPSSISKTPKADFPIDFYDLNPAWRLSLLEMCDPFGWHEIQKDKLAEVREKLGQFESLTWREILIDRKNLHHFIAIEDLSKEARDRLEELNLDADGGVTSLRLSGSERVFGLRQKGAFTLLWWDPDHKVCPSQKKHT